MARQNRRREEEWVPPEHPPAWVQDIVERRRGADVRPLLQKTLEASDVDRQQNRLLIPRYCVTRFLLPSLALDELHAANLIGHADAPVAGIDGGNINIINPATLIYDDKGRFVEVKEVEIKKNKKKGEVAGTKLVPPPPKGMAVSAYTRGGWWAYLGISKWGSSGGTVINGAEWRKVAALAGLEAERKVQVWSFRSPVVCRLTGEERMRLNIVVGAVD